MSNNYYTDSTTNTTTTVSSPLATSNITYGTTTNELYDYVCHKINNDYWKPVSVTTNGTEILLTDNSDLEDFFAQLGITLKDKNGKWRPTVEILKETVNKYNEYINNDKENKTMKFNFDFGPCTRDNVRMSMYGIAIKNTAGTWVSYDPNAKSIVDVDVFNFEGGKYLYKLPVAFNDIAVGDVVIHNRVPMIVLGKSGTNTLTAVDPFAGEEKTILLTTNMFGFNFATKVVNLFANVMQTPTTNAPFGNMLPFLLMSESNSDIDPMMIYMLMGQNDNMTQNPMMFYFLMKDKKDIDPLMLMMFAGQGFAVPGFPVVKTPTAK